MNTGSLTNPSSAGRSAYWSQALSVRPTRHSTFFIDNLSVRGGADTAAYLRRCATRPRSRSTGSSTGLSVAISLDFDRCQGLGGWTTEVRCGGGNGQTWRRPKTLVLPNIEHCTADTSPTAFEYVLSIPLSRGSGALSLPHFAGRWAPLWRPASEGARDEAQFHRFQATKQHPQMRCEDRYLLTMGPVRS